jgi:hypothetical protein
MSDTYETRKQYKSPAALARAVINGTGFKTDGYYNLTTPTDEDDVVAVLTTTAPVGPVSGKSVWRLDIQPHPWGQEVAEMVWDGLEWEEVTEDSNEPGPNTNKTGWTCGINVEITYG